MKQSGVTLLELMVVLAIAAILLTIGIPSFASLAQSSRLSTATNELLAALHLARSEAIKRSARAVICSSASGAACANSGDWDQGWLVFHDANNNANVDAGEAVILRRQALPAGLRATSRRTYISYTPDGSTKWTSGALQGGTFTVCNDTGSPVAARELIISLAGRARTAKMTLASCP